MKYRNAARAGRIHVGVARMARPTPAVLFNLFASPDLEAAAGKAREASSPSTGPRPGSDRRCGESPLVTGRAAAPVSATPADSDNDGIAARRRRMQVPPDPDEAPEGVSPAPRSPGDQTPESPGPSPGGPPSPLRGGGGGASAGGEVEPLNPFYLLLLLAGLLFVITALAYAVIPVLEQRAIDAGEIPPPSAFRDALRAHGWRWLLYELAAVAVLSIASMWLDRLRSLHSEKASGTIPNTTPPATQ